MKKYTCSQCRFFVEKPDSIYKAKNARFCQIHEAMYYENHAICEYFEDRDIKPKEKIEVQPQSFLDKIQKYL